MLQAGWKSLLARKLRLAMSAFAIILGVAFVAGSFIFTDTLARAFSGIVEGSVGEVVVRPKGSDMEVQSGRTIPASLVAELAQAEGVARADGNVMYPAAFVIDTDGKLVGGTGAPGLAVNLTDAPAAGGQAFGTVETGRVPDQAGEIALDVATAEKAGYALGDMVPFLTPGDPPRAEAELVGTLRFSGGIVGASVAIFETTYAQGLFLGGEDVFHDVWVTPEQGVSQAEARDAVTPLLPEGLEAITGADAAAEAENTIATALGFINTFLLIFAAVALVVGTFLIINTFSILVVQRSRELALFRAIGATRSQVTRSVILEAVVVGVIGATLGLVLGAGLAMVIRALFATFGLDLTGTPLTFTWKPVVASYAVGILVTVLAAYLPARRAGQVPPIAAMREDALVTETSMRRRLIVGLAMVVGGIAAGLASFLVPDLPQPMAFLGAGILLTLLGVVLTSPVLGRPVLALFGAVYARLFGAVGTMSKENSLRNPRRTAATASALMIGLTLVAMMSVFGASAKASIDTLVAENAAADFAVSNPINQPFAPSITDHIAAVDGVDEVMRVRYGRLDIDGSTEVGFGMEPSTFGEFMPIPMVSGSLADLGDRSIAVADSVSGVELGEVLSVSFAGTALDLTVDAVFGSSPILSGVSYVLPLQTLSRLGVEELDSVAYITSDGSVPLEELHSRLDAAVAEVPIVTVTDQEGYAEQLRAPVDQLLFIIYALLGLAVVIAVLGIVNTLALSVIERTREIGLLRAVGLSRRQLRLMIRLESIVIALLGAALGVGLGLVFGVAIQQALVDEGFEVLAIPVTQLAVFVALAGLVGILAAWWPGRRAANLNVLEAIATE